MKKQTLFSQGEPAEAVFYVQSGKVKLTVVSHQGREAVIAILDMGPFSEKPAWPDREFARRPRRPSRIAVSYASRKTP
jgi:CRP-like cAMP-binding protein